MALNMVVEEVGTGCSVATISGALTMGTNLKTLDNNLQSLIAGDVRHLVLDVTACSYADSSGLGLLMHTYGLMDEHGGKLRLCGASERLISLLRMTRTDGILACDPDRAASLAAIGS
jgi:anti-sigma B factor antagonist